MRVAITGGSGYIGRHLARWLESQHVAVVALTRAENRQFRCVGSGEVGPLEYHFDEIDHVVHLAGRLVDDPDAGVMDYMPANVALTDAVIQAARERGVASIVHASSRLVYPGTLSAPAVEDRDRWPDTPYGISKAWAEDLLRHASARYGMSTISLRIAQVTGREHPGLGVINSFVRQAREHRVISVQGRGSAVREFVHVEDVVGALAAATRYDGSWTAVNVGGTRAVTIKEIAGIVQAQEPDRVSVRHVPAEVEDVSYFALDSQRSRELLDWKPTWSPEDMIAAAYEHGSGE